MPVPAVYQASCDVQYARVTGVAAAAASQVTPLTDSRSGQPVLRAGGFLYGYQIVAVGLTAPAFVKFYDSAAAAVVVGTTPVLYTVALNGAGDSKWFRPVNKFLAYDSTLSVAATNLGADNDTTALTSGSVTVQAFYR